MHKVTFILLVIGGLNWGLEIFGTGIGKFLPMMVSKVVYALVALSAIYELATHKNCCKMCDSGMQKTM